MTQGVHGEDARSSAQGLHATPTFNFKFNFRATCYTPLEFVLLIPFSSVGRARH